MNDFDKKLKKWNKNGVAEFIQQRYRHQPINIQQSISNSYAEIAHHLKLDDLFANKTENIRFLDGYYYLRQLMQENTSAEQAALLSRFSKDFADRFLGNITDETEQRISMNALIKMGDFINSGIITSKNYDSSSQILLNSFESLKNNTPDFKQMSQSNLIQKIFSSKISSELEGTFTFSNNSDYFKRLRIISEAAKTFKDYDKLKFLTEGLDCYLRREMSINDSFFKGMLENVIPDINEGKENTKEDNLWGMYFFDYGIADLKYKALTTKITPASLSELLQAYKETPTADFKTFEQNRIDGLTLQNINPDFSAEKGLDSLRDAIHDQRPLTAELIKSMVEYYDAVKKGDNVGDTMCKMLEINRRNLSFEIDEKHLTGLIYYDQKAETYVEKGNFEPVIDVLRRLDKNMNQKEKPSGIKDQEISTLIDQYDEKVLQTNWLGQVLEKTNAYILQKMEKNQIGIDPKMLGLITWLDNKCAAAINNMDYEYQVAAFKEPWFKEAVKFSMLINNGGERFSETEFEQFYGQDFTYVSSEDMYEKINQRQNENLGRAQDAYLKQGIIYLQRVDPNMSKEEAARMLSKKASELCEVEVVEKFNRISTQNEGKEKLDATERRQLFIIFQYHERLERMGSGNSLKSLQNLISPHEASTIAGRRYRADRLKNQPKIDNLYKTLKRSNIDISFKGTVR